MPTILRVDGFQFFFFANDHEPWHIHVKKGEDYARINLDDLTVTDAEMNPKDLKKALGICMLHKDEFREAWNEWFKNR